MTNTEQHYILTDSQQCTVAIDKIGARAGMGAYARMLDRMADAAEVDRLRPCDDTGRRFDGGFVLNGPFHKL